MKHRAYLPIFFFTLLGAMAGVGATMLDRRLVDAHPVASESIGILIPLFNAIVMLPTGLLHEYFVGDSRYHPMTIDTAFMAASAFNSIVGAVFGTGLGIVLKEFLRRR